MVLAEPSDAMVLAEPSGALALAEPDCALVDALRHENTQLQRRNAELAERSMRHKREKHLAWKKVLWIPDSPDSN